MRKDNFMDLKAIMDINNSFDIEDNEVLSNQKILKNSKRCFKYNNQLFNLNGKTTNNNQEEPEEGRKIQAQQMKQIEQIEKTGMLTSTNGHHMIHCLTIIGQIEGHYILPSQNKTTKYEYVIPQLIAVEETPDIKGLLIILNTVGGDVEAGLAISELISGMKKPTVSLVLGGGHSIGVPLAVSAKKSFIVPSATMTIHPVRMNGIVVGIPQAFSYFDKIQDRIIRFVVSNSKISKNKFRRLLMNTREMVNDVGTVLDGKMAVNCGLIDKLGSLSDALSELYHLIDELDHKRNKISDEVENHKKTKEFLESNKKIEI